MACGIAPRIVPRIALGFVPEIDHRIALRIVGTIVLEFNSGIASNIL